MLAVVYETFTGIEKEKFRKLLLHKRKACQLAFRLLVSKQNPDTVRFKQFYGLMRYYSPRTCKKHRLLFQQTKQNFVYLLAVRDVILIFRQLNQSNSGAITQEEFLNIYDVVTLKWHLKDPPDPWFSAAWPPLRTLCRASRTAVSWEYFEYVVCTFFFFSIQLLLIILIIIQLFLDCVLDVLIVANGIAMFVRVMQATDDLEMSARLFCASWDTFLFLSCKYSLVKKNY